MTAQPDVFNLSLVHYLNEPVVIGGVLVNRVVYSYDPFTVEDGKPYEELAFKGHKLTKAGKVNKTIAGYHHAHPIPDDLHKMWLIIMRGYMAEHLAVAAKSTRALS